MSKGAAFIASELYSENPEHPKADREHEGREQADGPSHGSEFGPQAVDTSVEALDQGLEASDVTLRRQLLAFRPGRSAGRVHDGFRYRFIRTRFPKCLDGGVSVEGGGEQDRASERSRKELQRGGDGDESADDGDDADSLNPQGAVDVGAKLGEVRFRGDLFTRGAMNLDNGACLPIVEAGIAKPVGCGEGVEAGGVHRRSAAARLRIEVPMRAAPMTEGECTTPRSVPHSLAMYRLVAPEMMGRMVGGRQETTRKSRYVNEITN